MLESQTWFLHLLLCISRSDSCYEPIELLPRTLTSLSEPPVASLPEACRSTLNTGSLLCHKIKLVANFIEEWEQGLPNHWKSGAKTGLLGPHPGEGNSRPSRKSGEYWHYLPPIRLKPHYYTLKSSCYILCVWVRDVSSRRAPAGVVSNIPRIFDVACGSFSLRGATVHMYLKLWDQFYEAAENMLKDYPLVVSIHR